MVIIFNPDKINFNLAPSTDLEKIKQIVRNIILTELGECPYCRDFGIDGVIIDAPSNSAKAKINSSIISCFQKYLPDAKIESIKWPENANLDGRFSPEITIQWRGNE